MTRHTGAYARQLGVEAPSEPLLDLSPVEQGPGWRAYAQTSSGLTVTPCGPNERHARKVNATRQALFTTGRAVELDGTMLFGGVVVDPDGVHHDEWGGPVDPHRSRWRFIVRVDHWRHCQACGTPMWPGRVITLKMNGEHATKYDSNDEVCSSCQQAREIDDPRPAWPTESDAPPLDHWPDWMRPDKKKRVALPKGFKFLGQPRRRG